MRLITSNGDLPFRLFTFPDGQRHFQLLMPLEDPTVTIETRIASADELFDVLLAKDTLDGFGCITSLNIRYLLGARMDRRVSNDQPFTLSVVSRMLLGAGFRYIRVLDPHSIVTKQLLGAYSMLPQAIVKRVLDQYHPFDTVIISPDAGATERVKILVPTTFSIRQGRKHRDTRTGALSSFSVDDASFLKDKTALIIDDICDGGGTFVGLANILREAGAHTVDLYVTHGIFSQGIELHGINRIYTTDSYQDIPVQSEKFVQMKVVMTKGIEAYGT